MWEGRHGKFFLAYPWLRQGVISTHLVIWWTQLELLAIALYRSMHKGRNTLDWDFNSSVIQLVLEVPNWYIISYSIWWLGWNFTYLKNISKTNKRENTAKRFWIWNGDIDNQHCIRLVNVIIFRSDSLSIDKVNHK